MAIQGLRDTSNFVSEARPKNWRQGILLLDPNGMTPLTALSSLMKSKTTDDPEFAWWEKSLQTRRIALTTTITTSTTTLAFSAGGCNALKAGDILYVEENNELMLVVADPTSDTAITVSRGAAGSTAAAITVGGEGVNPNFRVAGNANEEGSLAPTGVAFDPTKQYNYTQIFRNTLELTRTAAKTRLRTVDAVKEAKRECLQIHNIDMEMAFWLGNRTEGTFQGKPRRFTGGILEKIPSANVVDSAGAATDMETLEGYLERMFRFGSQEKMAFCGNISLLTINQIVRKNSTYNIQLGVKEYGMSVTRLTTPFGELVLKTHPLFNQMTGGTTGTTPYYALNSWMFVLDMKEIVYRPFNGADTKYQPKLEANGLDGMQSGYLTECGLEIHHPTSHFLIKGLASAAADS
jgi:hypothetical protein